MSIGGSSRVLVGLIVVAVGVLLLLGNLGLGDFSPWEYAPSLLIVLGHLGIDSQRLFEGRLVPGF